MRPARFTSYRHTLRHLAVGWSASAAGGSRGDRLLFGQRESTAPRRAGCLQTTRSEGRGEAGLNCELKAVAKRARKPMARCLSSLASAQAGLKSRLYAVEGPPKGGRYNGSGNPKGLPPPNPAALKCGPTGLIFLQRAAELIRERADAA